MASASIDDIELGGIGGGVGHQWPQRSLVLPPFVVVRIAVGEHRISAKILPEKTEARASPF